ncbi:MAG: class I SAM-dependent methyltransferase [Anaerolineae bacterium]|nr:class I SAM-dependent methyltransferase [Anaerolineae bacterium]
MVTSPGTDRDLLTRKAYATDDALAVRQRIHDQYSVPPTNFLEWVLEREDWHGDEIVLDVGAGPGVYFEPAARRASQGAVIGADLSFGMAQRANSKGIAQMMTNADVQALPFASSTFDVVLANHMLYHVPDLDEALSEIHRVLKPTGFLIAATNSQFNMPEFDQLTRRVFSQLGVTGNEVENFVKQTSRNFNLEDAPSQLSHYFGAVARFDLPSALVFPSKQPVLDYFNSMRALKEPLLPSKVTWEDFMNQLGDQVNRLITHFGELVVNKLAGVVIGTDVGGFAREYMELLRESADS